MPGGVTMTLWKKQENRETNSCQIRLFRRKQNVSNYNKHFDRS